jgi:DNA-binding transcriptional LysR family regulator
MPSPGLQLRHLQTFIAIVEAGTLTAAAERLFKTQGAVSHDLKSLEQVVGVQLIDRDRQRIELTAAGDALLPHAEGLLARTAAAEGEMREFRFGRRVALRVGSLPSLARRLGTVVRRHRELEPGTTIRIVTDRGERLTDLLAAGRLDLVVVDAVARNGITTRLLGHDHFQVVLPAGDTRAGGPPVTARELLGRDFIGFNRDVETPRIAERFFAATGAYPDPVVEATDFAQILDLVAAGLGYGLLPAGVVAGSERVVGIPTDPPLVREIAVQTRDPGPMPAPSGRFRELLEESWRRPEES